MERKRISGCLVLHENAILLLKKRTHQWWEIPGGKIAENETPEDAALRELKEEVSCNGTVLASLDTIEFQHKGYQAEFHLFHVAIQDPSAIRLSEPEEFEDVRFVPFDEIESLPFSPVVNQLFQVIELREQVASQT